MAEHYRYPEGFKPFTEEEQHAVFRTGFTIMGELPPYSLVEPILAYDDIPLLNASRGSVDLPNFFKQKEAYWCFDRAQYLQRRMCEEGFPHTYAIAGAHRNFFFPNLDRPYEARHGWVIVSPVNLLQAPHNSTGKIWHDTFIDYRLPLLDPSLIHGEIMTPDTDYQQSHLYFNNAPYSANFRTFINTQSPLMLLEDGVLSFGFGLSGADPVISLSYIPAGAMPQTLGWYYPDRFQSYDGSPVLDTIPKQVRNKLQELAQRSRVVW